MLRYAAASTRARSVRNSSVLVTLSHSTETWLRTKSSLPDESTFAATDDPGSSQNGNEARPVPSQQNEKSSSNNRAARFSAGLEQIRKRQQEQGGRQKLKKTTNQRPPPSLHHQQTRHQEQRQPQHKFHNTRNDGSHRQPLNSFQNASENAPDSVNDFFRDRRASATSSKSSASHSSPRFGRNQGSGQSNQNNIFGRKQPPTGRNRNNSPPSNNSNDRKGSQAFPSSSPGTKSKDTPLFGTSASSNTSSQSKTEDDMTDVSALRAAFMKSLAVDRERRLEKSTDTTKQQLPQPNNKSNVKSNWRRGGAKEFRQTQMQRRQEQQGYQRDNGGSGYHPNNNYQNFDNNTHNRRPRPSSSPPPRQWRDGAALGEAFFGNFEADSKAKKEEEKKRKEHAEALREDKRVALDFDGPVTVQQFADTLRVGRQTVMKTLKTLGERKADQDGYLVDLDIMELAALELGLEPERNNRHFRKIRTSVEDDRDLLLQRRAGVEEAGVEDESVSTENAYESFPTRPPVVCLMGHVDHGKTTLMDALRRKSQVGGNKAASGKKKKKAKNKDKTKNSKGGDVAGTEAGGITQVISAFQVALENQDSAVTFLDTPGHAAFRSMRESGTHAADVIVLVVAADDGVSPQTVEILNFYKSIVKEAGGGAISLVVAMTKIDKPGIDADEAEQRIEYQLLEHGIMTENMAAGTSDEPEYGPPVQLFRVSGMTGEGLDDLVEGLVLQSEIMDLRADEKARGEGIVMDARIEKGLGVVADCIVRWGSMSRGDVVVSGLNMGKIKVLKDVNDKTLKMGMPSQPVRVLGFESLPKAGDPLVCVASEDIAEKLIKRRENLMMTTGESSSPRQNTENEAEFQVTGTASKTAIMTGMAEKRYDIEDTDLQQIRIPVIIKADADGTLAAVRESLMEIGDTSTLDLLVDPVGTGIGAILNTDIALAKQSGAHIYSFGLKSLNDRNTLSLAASEGVTIHSHDVIYSLLDDAKDAFAQYMPPTPVETVHGKATIQAVFDINNKKDAERIAGLSVTDGTLYKQKADGGTKVHYRVIRDGTRISPEGETVTATSLKKVKDDADSVRRGDECGLGLSGFHDFEKGDIIECYTIEMKHSFV